MNDDEFAAVLGAQAEAERLRAFMRAIRDHGSTVWPDSTCGHGGVGGQMMTTTGHPEVVEHLAGYALLGRSLTEAADDYAVMWPGTTRLDDSPGRSGRAGPDGRPRPKPTART